MERPSLLLTYFRVSRGLNELLFKRENAHFKKKCGPFIPPVFWVNLDTRWAHKKREAAERSVRS